MLLFIKADLPVAQREAVLEFLWGDAFRSVLQAGDFHFVNQMDWQRRYSFPDWDRLAASDYNAQSEALGARFIAALPPGAMTV